MIRPRLLCSRELTLASVLTLYVRCKGLFGWCPESGSKEATDLVRGGGTVSRYEPWLPLLEEFPDPDDRHVVAAAIECGATTIVTGNVRDFPQAVLAPFGIRAVKLDDFALAGIDADPVPGVGPVLDEHGHRHVRVPAQTGAV